MILNGTIIKGIGGFYYVESAEKIYECKARGAFRKQKISPLTGDFVDFSVSEGNDNAENYIIKIHERRNYFNRPPVANVDNLVIVSSTCEPNPNTLIIDRLTVAAIHKGVEPVIVFTKDDMLSSEKLVKIYKNTGIPVFSVSNKSGDGIPELKEFIRNKISVFTGNSGVGKSSVINSIAPDFSLATGEISKKLGRGRHTTRHVELFKALGGYIADTPGFSSLDFETNDIIKKDELAECFPEFREYIGLCKFTSCSHINDKGCKIKDAVEKGLISSSRHDSYIALYNEVKDIKDWQL